MKFKQGKRKTFNRIRQVPCFHCMKQGTCLCKKEQQTGHPGALKTASGYGKMNSEKQLKEDMTEDE